MLYIRDFEKMGATFQRESMEQIDGSSFYNLSTMHIDNRDILIRVYLSKYCISKIVGVQEYPDTTKKYFSGSIILHNVRCQVDFMRLQDGVIVAQRYLDEDKASAFKQLLFAVVSEDDAFSTYLFTRHSRQLFRMTFEIISVLAMIIGLLARNLLGTCGFVFFLITFIVFFRRSRFIRGDSFEKQESKVE